MLNEWSWLLIILDLPLDEWSERALAVHAPEGLLCITEFYARRTQITGVLEAPSAKTEHELGGEIAGLGLFDCQTCSNQTMPGDLRPTCGEALWRAYQLVSADGAAPSLNRFVDETYTDIECPRCARSFIPDFASRIAGGARRGSSAGTRRRTSPTRSSHPPSTVTGWVRRSAYASPMSMMWFSSCEACMHESVVVWSVCGQRRRCPD